MFQPRKCIFNKFSPCFRRRGNAVTSFFSHDDWSHHASFFLLEPEKLHIIQQYLKSSTSRLTGQNVTSGESIASAILNDESNLTTATANMTTLTSMMAGTIIEGAFTMDALLNSDPSFPGSTLPPTGAETVAASQNVINATRYCDDCLEGEVCVALVDEEVPICRSPRDRNDPTGCAGFCIISKQKCHRLDFDAFRFVATYFWLIALESFVSLLMS